MVSLAAARPAVPGRPCMAPREENIIDVLARLAPEVIARLRDRGFSLAVAESCTGGLVCDALTDVAGASAVLRGGVVAYTEAAKTRLLAVPAELLARTTAVSPAVAAAMASGAATVLASSVGGAVVGWAGPGGDPRGVAPVGTVHVAVEGVVTGARSLRLAGGRRAIKEGAAAALLNLISDLLDDDPRQAGEGGTP